MRARRWSIKSSNKVIVINMIAIFVGKYANNNLQTKYNEIHFQ